MKKEKRPIKKRLLHGAISGVTFATTMALFDWWDNNPFSIIKFLFFTIFFGLAMSFAFRYKHTK